MKINVVSEKLNPLLKRKELTFEVEHSENGGTPYRFEIRKRLAEILKCDLDLVYIKKVETKRGTMIAIGEATIYASIEQAKLIEPKHILIRNMEKKGEKSQNLQKSED